jgi:hypothetical protein
MPERERKRERERCEQGPAKQKHYKIDLKGEESERVSHSR